MSTGRWLAGALVAASSTMAMAMAAFAETPPSATAVFAGGCFWCMEPPFEKLDGVTRVTSGYTGGREASPTYEAVSAGRTGHYEAVQVTYDPQKISYPTLLEVFWKNVDPLDDGGQFCDRGGQYRAAIFYQSPEQEKAAAASKAAIERSGVLPKPIVTPILPATSFYPAEDYHQDYYKKNPRHYQSYRVGCGRDRRLAALWGDAAKPGP